MKHVTKKILVSALVLGLSGGVYAQAGGGAGAGGGGAGGGGAGGGSAGGGSAGGAGVGGGGAGGGSNGAGMSGAPGATQWVAGWEPGQAPHPI
jgi:hypothetical protein